MSFRRLAAPAGIILLLMFGGALFFLFDPSETWFFPHCPFFALTGLKCPGCGTARAFHAALQRNAASHVGTSHILLNLPSTYATFGFRVDPLGVYRRLVDRP